MVFQFWNNTRLFVQLISLCCLTLLQINSQIFTFTVICMDDIKMNHTGENQHWIDSNSDKNILFSATAVGALFGIIPAVPLLHKFGVRKIQTLCGIFSSIGTILFPFSVDYTGYFGVMICRVLQGFGISILLTLIGVIPRSWSPEDEVGTYLAILSCAYQISSTIFLSSAGFMCESSLSWRFIYYLFGFISVLFFGIFYVFYTDSPKSHRNVSISELQKIETGKKETAKEKVPYFAICTDLCNIIAWISFLGGNLGYTTFLLYGPTYLRDILKMDAKTAGLSNGIPYLFCAIIKLVVGRVSDKLPGIREKTRFTCWLFISVIGIVIGMLVMAWTDDHLIAQGGFTFSIATSGLVIMAAIRCLQLRTLQHCHFAVSVISFLAYVVQFIIPLGVDFICPDNTPQQWSKLFIVISILMILTSIPFPFITTQNAGKYTKKHSKIDIISDDKL
ncbi:unnamed protein product [Caenorhabditis angaria]|uniref:Major facilitator superfamily (MFS) profile domain-containing protein n=1 Tax=Caenorhabditis angaria TaxID=860376 RepID=A0A9P1N6F2_9PELO|nr:unnamed protein product [Caenorhabditis angaria]